MPQSHIGFSKSKKIYEVFVHTNGLSQRAVYQTSSLKTVSVRSWSFLFWKVFKKLKRLSLESKLFDFVIVDGKKRVFKVVVMSFNGRQVSELRVGYAFYFEKNIYIFVETIFWIAVTPNQVLDKPFSWKFL